MNLFLVDKSRLFLRIFTDALLEGAFFYNVNLGI